MCYRLLTKLQCVFQRLTIAYFEENCFFLLVRETISLSGAQVLGQSSGPVKRPTLTTKRTAHTGLKGYFGEPVLAHPFFNQCRLCIGTGTFSRARCRGINFIFKYLFYFFSNLTIDHLFCQNFSTDYFRRTSNANFLGNL